jgi:GNAT superfamily N-acetyltransferase
VTAGGTWRPLREEDIPAVTAISDVVHGRFTERPEVFAERLSLYPEGCFMLDHDGAAEGYLISHPWHRRSPVPLDQLIGAIPEDAGSYYLHDLALLPDTRGFGAGRRGVELVLAHASDAGFGQVSLVAVNGADAFWAALGFSCVEDEAVARQLQSYGEGTFFMERGL